MSEQPDLSTLPQRMRDAADVIAEYISSSALLHSGTAFAPHNLRLAAERLEARLESQTEELAEEMYAASFAVKKGWAADRSMADRFRASARKLVESGWRKGEPDE